MVNIYAKGFFRYSAISPSLRLSKGLNELVKEPL